MTPDKDPELLTVTQAAERLGVSRQRVDRLVRKGVLRHVWWHSMRYIPAADVTRRLRAVYEGDAMLTTADVAELCHVSEPTVEVWRKRGLIAGHMTEQRRRRYSVDEVQQLIEYRKQRGALMRLAPTKGTTT